jgi:hypothetical protein
MNKEEIGTNRTTRPVIISMIDAGIKPAKFKKFPYLGIPLNKNKINFQISHEHSFDHSQFLWTILVQILSGI